MMLVDRDKAIEACAKLAEVGAGESQAAKLVNCEVTARNIAAAIRQLTLEECRVETPRTDVFVKFARALEAERIKMPTYVYRCPNCGTERELVRRINERNDPPLCLGCGEEMMLKVAAPLFKFKGRVTPGGGPDRFTADMMGIPLKELPADLRADAPLV